MGTPTRFPSGVTNVDKAQTLGSYVAQDPTKVHQYFEEFDYYASGSWNITETSASAARALTDEDGGVFLITNSAADDAIVSLQKKGESFLFESGKKQWFKARFKASDASLSDILVGLAIEDTSPFDATDGVYFVKLSGSTTVNMIVVKDSTATTTSAATLVSDTFIELGYVYNGKDEIGVYVNDVCVGRSAVTNLPDDEELTVTMTIQNGEAVAKTLAIDYIFCAKER